VSRHHLLCWLFRVLSSSARRLATLALSCMNVAYSDSELTSYLEQAAAVNRDHPVVISKFILDAKVCYSKVILKIYSMYF